MGLREEGAEALQRATQAEEQQAAAEVSRRSYLRADWTEELRGMIAERGFATQYLYAVDEHTELEKPPVLKMFRSSQRSSIVRTRYLGECWLLRGWEPDSEHGPTRLHVALFLDGSIGAMSFFSELGGRAVKGVLTTREVSILPTGGPSVVRYPDVSVSHVGRAFVTPFDLTRPSADFQTKVGASVAAAVIRGDAPTNGVLDGVIV